MRLWSFVENYRTAPPVPSLVLFPFAAANLGYPGIVTGGAVCRVLGSTRRA